MTKAMFPKRTRFEGCLQAFRADILYNYDRCFDDVPYDGQVYADEIDWWSTLSNDLPRYAGDVNDFGHMLQLVKDGYALADQEWDTLDENSYLDELMQDVPDEAWYAETTGAYRLADTKGKKGILSELEDRVVSLLVGLGFNDYSRYDEPSRYRVRLRIGPRSISIMHVVPLRMTSIAHSEAS